MNVDPHGVVAHQPHCMGCGPENPAGLGLQMRIDGDRVYGHVRFDRRQEGAPGIAHGGAVSTAIDDLMGTVLLIVNRPAVTVTLTVDFRAPTLLDRDLELEGWCERIDGRKLHLRSTVSDSGTVVAEGHAIFLEVDLEHFRRGGQPLPETWQRWGGGRSQ